MERIKFILISLLSIFICVISFSITYGILMPAIVDNEVGTDDYNNYFLKNDVDYVLKGVSQEQIHNFEGMDSVKTINDYYLSETTSVNVGEKKYGVDLYIMHSFENLAGTPFENTTDLTIVDNPAIIDYYFAKKAGVKEGDAIEIIFSGEKIIARIIAIVPNNYINKKGCVAITYEPNKSIIDAAFGGNAFFNYCYVSTTNKEEFDTYLKECYKPELNKPKSEDYEYYTYYVEDLERYNNQNYYCAPYVVKVQKDIDYTKDMEVMSAKEKRLAVIAICLAIIIGNIVVAVLYSITLRPIGRSNGEVKFYVLIHLVSLVVSILLISIIACVCSITYNSSVAAYVDHSAFEYMLPLFIAAVICATVGETIKVLSSLFIIRKKGNIRNISTTNGEKTNSEKDKEIQSSNPNKETNQDNKQSIK